ncbi:hypothetical protein ACHAWX_004581 [Stephanocyclus meneghinianus]
MDLLINNIMPSQLLPCLAIPFVELFPDLCLGWWTPPSLDLKQYASLGMLRVLLQLIAWLPVLEMVLPIYAGDNGTFSFLVLCAVGAIVGRSVVMTKQIQRVTAIPLWNTTLPHDKRQALFVAVTHVKPSNINKFDEICVRYVALPTKLVGIAVFLLVNILYNKLESEEDKMKILVIMVLVIIGGVGINGMRHANIGMDIMFRCVFGLGFVGLMHYLGQVSDMLIIRSIK